MHEAMRPRSFNLLFVSLMSFLFLFLTQNHSCWRMSAFNFSHCLARIKKPKFRCFLRYRVYGHKFFLKYRHFHNGLQAFIVAFLFITFIEKLNNLYDRGN
jgi:hypothetical protein